MIRFSGRSRAWGMGGVLSLAISLWGCATTRYEAVDMPPPQVLSTPKPDSSTAQPVRTADPAEVDTLNILLSDQARRLADLADLNAELSNKIALFNDRIKALEDQVQSLSAPQQAARPPRGRKVVPSAQGRIKTLYQTALRDFEARRFDSALKNFSEILTSAPKDVLADNAQYWAGECQYGLKNYAQAIKEFQKVFVYPRSSKDDDAQLKIGLCYSKMGDAEKAIIELKRLTVDYPESEYVGRAEALLRDLQSHKGQTTK